MKQEEPKEEIIIDPVVDMMIPRCCKEGWESCVHVVKKEKPKKHNIGL